MDSELLNELITVHLRYTAGARPLRIRAIAQMAAKILYTMPAGQTAKTKVITDDIGVVLGIARVSDKDVVEALRLLESSGIAKEEEHNWRLSENGQKQIEIDITQSRTVIGSVIERHFPPAIPREQIGPWFRDTCAEYFGKYGTYWTASIFVESGKRIIPPPATWKNTIPITAAKHGIEQKYFSALITGFSQFINSSDQRDSESMWLFGQAMFAARLIAARMGANPITTRLIKDAIFLLDTNVLLISCLEAHRLAASFESLSNALKILNIKLMFLPITRDEYENVVSRAKEDTLQVVARYPASVLTRASDAFVRTALGRGCKTVEEFEDFFKEIAKAPSKIDDEPITLCQDEELLTAAAQGAVNEELLTEVSDAWKSLRHSDKPIFNIIHDASLMYAIETANVGKRTYWALSLDRSMSSLSSVRAGKHELTSWISLDALLQILAVDLAGPSLQAENFGPLLATILENEAQPMPGTFETRDLAWLLDIEERCADLSDEQVTACATIVNQARLTGKQHDDPELQLDIQRAFQGDRLNLVKEINTTKADLAATKGDLAIATDRLEELRKALLTEHTAKLRREAWKSFALKAIPTALFSMGFIGSAVWVAINFNSDDSILKIIGISAVLFSAGVITLPLMLLKQASKLRKSLRLAVSRADTQIASIEDV